MCLLNNQASFICKCLHTTPYLQREKVRHAGVHKSFALKNTCIFLQTQYVSQSITVYVRGEASCGGRHLFVDLAR